MKNLARRAGYAIGRRNAYAENYRRAKYNSELAYRNSERKKEEDRYEAERQRRIDADNKANADSKFRRKVAAKNLAINMRRLKNEEAKNASSEDWNNQLKEKQKQEWADKDHKKNVDEFVKGLSPQAIDTFEKEGGRDLINLDANNDLILSKDEIQNFNNKGFTQIGYDAKYDDNGDIIYTDPKTGNPAKFTKVQRDGWRKIFETIDTQRKKQESFKTARMQQLEDKMLSKGFYPVENEADVQGGRVISFGGRKWSNISPDKANDKKSVYFNDNGVEDTVATVAERDLGGSFSMYERDDQGNVIKDQNGYPVLSSGGENIRRRFNYYSSKYPGESIEKLAQMALEDPKSSNTQTTQNNNGIPLWEDTRKTLRPVDAQMFDMYRGEINKLIKKNQGKNEKETRKWLRLKILLQRDPVAFSKEAPKYPEIFGNLVKDGKEYVEGFYASKGRWPVNNKTQQPGPEENQDQANNGNRQTGKIPPEVLKKLKYLQDIVDGKVEGNKAKASQILQKAREQGML